MTGSAAKPLLVDTGKGFSVKWHDRFLYSSRDPLSSVTRAVDRWKPEPDTLYLIPSPLLGYGLGEMKKRLPPGSFLLGVERFQELMALTQPHLPPDLADEANCRIFRSENISLLCAFVESLGLERFRRCRRVELSGGARLDPDFYQSLEEELGRRIFQHWQTRASLLRMGPLWFRNICRNFTAFTAGKPAGSLSVRGPILLCGAGESLEELLPLIKKHRDRFFLCAVDTAYPVLTGAGIFPDGVFNLDGQFYNLYDFYSHGAESVYLFSDITASPPSLRLEGMKPLFFSSHFADNDLLSRLEEASLLPDSLPPLGSVGVTSLYLCTLLGEGPYLFGGLDFSYLPGKSHARGTVFHNLFLSRNGRTCPDGDLTSLSLRRPEKRLPGRLTGKLLRSDTVLEGYYRSFREIASALADRAYQLTGDYPDLGVPSLDGEGLGQLLESAGPVRVEETPSAPAGERASRFLTEEVTRLEGIVSAWESFSAGGSEGPLEEALKRCSYPALTVGFDRNGRREAFYSEAVKNARAYLAVLQKSLAP